jgi:hypothetical protein
MHADQLPITGPCPIDLDAIGFDRTSKVSHCSHCVKNVTVLSNMTKGEAREFLREHQGQNLCVSYVRGADGQIRFRPDPEPVLVPVARLRPRPSRGAGLVAALGVGVALAACTPHGEAPRNQPIAAKHDTSVEGGMRVPRTEPDPVPTAGLAMVPEDIAVDGGMRVPNPAELDEPCDKGETKVEPKKPEPKKPHPRKKIEPPVPDPVPVAGGISIPHDIEIDGELMVPDPSTLDASKPTRG